MYHNFDFANISFRVMMKIALPWKPNWMDGMIEIAMTHLHLFAKAYQK